MKKSLLILLFCMIANYVHAQILIRVGYGSNYNTPTTFPTPFPDAVEGNRQQYLYRASDLTVFGMTKGIISSIGFDVRGTNPGAGEIENYTIKMGLTTATALTNTAWLSGTTTVYGPVNFTPTNGLNEQTLTTPFVWDGVKNLIVEICNGDPNNTTYVSSTFNYSVYRTLMNYIASNTYALNNGGNLCALNTTSQNNNPNALPNAYFRWESTDSCLPVQVPYVQNFDAAPADHLPICTSTENFGAANSGWGQSAAPYPNWSSRRAGFYSNSTQSGNAWLYTRGLILNGNTSYRLSFIYGNEIANYTNKLEVKYGTSATVDSMQTLILDNPSITSNSPMSSTTDLTPSVSGVYYLGFHGYSAPSQSPLFVDDISVTQTPTVPIVLSAFSGRRTGVANDLWWTTASEANNRGFELQRSADGKQFSSVAFVNTRATGGNSTQPLAYGYTDKEPLPGITYYRLKQVNNDGSIGLSNIIAIKGSTANEIVLSSVYPNPANSLVNVSLYAPTSQQASIVITDVLGRPVMVKPVNLVMGQQVFTLNIADVPAGIYMVKAMCERGCRTSIFKLIKERRR